MMVISVSIITGAKEEFQAEINQDKLKLSASKLANQEYV